MKVFALTLLLAFASLASAQQHLWVLTGSLQQIRLGIWQRLYWPKRWEETDIDIRITHSGM